MARKLLESCRIWLKRFDLGEIGTGILAKYFEFYTWDDEIDQQWQESIGMRGGYKFVVKPKRFDYSRSKKWMSRSGGGTLLLMAFESELRGCDLVKDIIEEAEMNPKQEKVARGLAERHHVDYEEVLDRVRGY